MARAITTLAIALYLVLGCSQAPQPSLVTVPNVIGLPVPQAEANLSAAGLESKPQVEGPCPACPGVQPPPTPVVQDEKPAAGSQVAKGTVVVLGYPCRC